MEASGLVRGGDGGEMVRGGSAELLGAAVEWLCEGRRLSDCVRGPTVDSCERGVGRVLFCFRVLFCIQVP